MTASNVSSGTDRLAQAQARIRRNDTFDQDDLAHFRARLLATFGTDVVELLNIQVEPHGAWGLHRQQLVGWFTQGRHTFVLSMAAPHVWQLGSPDNLRRYSACIGHTVDFAFPGEQDTARTRNGDALILALDDIKTGRFTRGAAWYGEVDDPQGINVELRDADRPDHFLKRMHLAAIPQVGHRIVLSEYDNGQLQATVTAVRHLLIEQDPTFCAALTTIEQTVVIEIRLDPPGDGEEAPGDEPRH